MDQYWRRAKIIRVVDGDTLFCDIDLGFGVRQQHYVRLADINTPEITTPEGVEARNFVTKWIYASVDWQKNPDAWFWLRTKKDKSDRYDRYLGYLYPYTMAPDVHLNDLLIEKGIAVEYMK